jgi:ATP phosphoribosyltransferase regulatory subunit
MASRFRYPTGVRPLLVEETARRRRVESRFVRALEASDFAEVTVPIIDYADPYAELEERAASRQSYRFVDREGDLVAIRADFTPTVARALAPTLRASDLPLRIFYRGDVIRCEATRLGAGREMFQIGAEVVGDASAEAEAEMMLLAAGMVAEFGIEPIVVYNDVAILELLVAAAGDEETSRAAVRAALVTKRTAPLADAAGLDPALANLVASLASGDATLGDLAAFPATAQRAERLADVQRRVSPGNYLLHLDDFDESSGYYTGLRFRLYGTDNRTPIARGGRYDSLYERFGTAAPAFGFTITIDDLD